MKTIGIICGGFSSEYEISVKSATNIKSCLPNNYQPYLIYLKKEGWFLEDNEEQFKMDISDFSYNKNGEKNKIDLAIVYIHGDPGENGKIQAFLDMINIPYINTGPLASQLSFDKWYCNQFLKGFNINVAESIYLNDKTSEVNIKEVVSKLKLPIFVKPCDSGSSFGIAKVSKEEELVSAINNAFNEGDSVVLESFLDGVEVTCAVYRNKTGIITLPQTEIVSENDFFDYEAKYKGLSQEITPARINENLTKLIQEKTIFIYKLLKLKSIARVDFMLVDNVPYVIEVNTIPGFSNESIIPKMIKTAGKTSLDLWTEILEAEA